MEELKKTIERAVFEKGYSNADERVVEEVIDYFDQNGIHSAKELRMRDISSLPFPFYHDVIMRVKDIVDDKDGFQNAVFFL